MTIPEPERRDGPARHLVLAGGGHAHVEVLRLLAARADSGWRVTLVNPEASALYSGMMPGLVAGHYARKDCEIALAPLCQRAGARLVKDHVSSLDAPGRALTLASGESLRFDLLSLNTGSTPDLHSVEGADRHAVSVKPMSGFMTAWNQVLDAQKRMPRSLLDAVVVGAGAGGVEVALAIQHRLATMGGAVQVTVASDQFLSGYPDSVRSGVDRVFRSAGIRRLDGVRAMAVTDAAVTFSSGQSVSSGFTVWAIGASAPAWIAASGLATDARGFLAVDTFLRSKSHPRVFAAGDIASLENPVPKAGVFSVRQAPILASNLFATFADAPLQPYAPQPRFLSLISLGNRRAIASWGPFKAEGAIVWRLKDHIDRKFIRRYVL